MNSFVVQTAEAVKLTKQQKLWNVYLAAGSIPLLTEFMTFGSERRLIKLPG